MHSGESLLVPARNAELVHPAARLVDQHHALDTEIVQHQRPGARVRSEQTDQQSVVEGRVPVSGLRRRRPDRGRAEAGAEGRDEGAVGSARVRNPPGRVSDRARLDGRGLQVVLARVPLHVPRHFPRLGLSHRSRPGSSSRRRVGQPVGRARSGPLGPAARQRGQRGEERKTHCLPGAEEASV